MSSRPSSVEREAKATHSGNACLHGMTNITAASIAYIATQVWVGSTNFCDASKYLKSFCVGVFQWHQGVEWGQQLIGLVEQVWGIPFGPLMALKGCSCYSDKCFPISTKSALGLIKAKHRQLNSASANSRALIKGSGTPNQYATAS